MQLTERHRVKRNNEMFKACDAICFASKNIFNRSLYLIKQDWEQRQSSDVLNNLNEVMKKEECFQAIPCNVAQQTIRMVQKVYKSFFRLIKAKEEGKIPKEQEVNEPSYLNKAKGRYVAQYTPRVISKKHFQKRGVVKLSQIDIEVKTKIKRYEDIALVRVVPKNDEYYIEVVYDVEDTPQLKSNRTYAAIDLGVNNLAAITFSKKGKQPLIVNGRPLKSINQYYNKKLAKLKSTLEVRNKQKSSHATRKLAAKRNNKVNDFMHKASRRIVDLLAKDDIRTLIIGKNDGWKQEVDMKKQNNQSFVSIPHSRFVGILSYKCEQKGIRVMLVEESYTSKASFLDLDQLPKHGEGEAPTFSGYRESRGLYKRKGVKERVNADVNGSYNIMRKAIPTFFNKGIEGVVVRPLVLNVS